MQYQVPQYVEVQEKIVGPLTLKQFFYIAGAGVLSFIAFYTFNLFLAIIISAVLLGSAGALAFVKINGRPLSKIIASAFKFFWQPRLYLWARKPATTALNVPELQAQVKTQTKLRDLGKKLLTSTTPIPKREDARSINEKFATLRKISGEAKAAKRVDYR